MSPGWLNGAPTHFWHMPSKWPPGPNRLTLRKENRGNSAADDPAGASPATASAGGGVKPPRMAGVSKTVSGATGIGAGFDDGAAEFCGLGAPADAGTPSS